VIAQTVEHGLAAIALKSKHKGEIGEKIAHYFRDRLQQLENSKLNPIFIEKVRVYGKMMAPIRVMDARIAALKKQAIKEYPNLTCEAELEKLKNERKELEKGLEDVQEIYRELLQEFQPLVKDILNDMGYPDARALPVPYFLKEVVWKALTEMALPDLCLTNFEKLLKAFDSLLPNVDEVKLYEDKLAERYQRNFAAAKPLQPGEKPPIVRGIYDLADHIIKQIEAYGALHGAEIGMKALDKIIIPEMYGGEKAQKAVHEVIDLHREEIEFWLGQESPGIAAFAKEQVGRALRQVIAGPILKCTSNLLDNLERIEKNNPEQLFDFIAAILPLFSDHLELATRVAKEQGKDYIHEVPPIIMARAFEKEGLLHKAMPGWMELKTLDDLEKRIAQLEEQVKQVNRQGPGYNWATQVADFKGKAVDKKLGPQHFLDAAKADQAALKKKVENNMQKNFYKDFSKYLLELGGIKGTADIPGGSEFWNLIPWTKEQLVDEQIPILFMELMRTTFAPKQMNGYMAKLLVALNENLTAKRQRGELEPAMMKRQSSAQFDEKVDEMEKRCQRFIKMMYKVLPGTLIEELKELPLINRIPGSVLADSLKEVLQQYPLSRVIEENFAELITKLPEKLPKTFAELDAAQKILSEEDKKNIEQIRQEAEKTVGNWVTKKGREFVQKWKKVHETIDKWLDKHLGKKAVGVKHFFDKVLRKVFIDNFIMKLLFAGVRRFVFFVTEAYARRVGRFAELGRESIIQPEINANLLFQIADQFKKMYAVSDAPSSLVG
jgi:hypothetical protein